jgi:hypothetical protein
MLQSELILDAKASHKNGFLLPGTRFSFADLDSNKCFMFSSDHFIQNNCPAGFIGRSN